MQEPKIKYLFSLKTKEELEKLSHEELLKYVKNLTDNVVREKPPKNSNNSSIPSSTEIVSPKKNQSLREKSDRTVGAQLGRKGITLLQTDRPDIVKELPYTLSECKKCGVDLTSIEAKLKEKRQVIDLKLSTIKSTITEHQSFTKRCYNCGYNNHDNAFSVAPNISYGATITAIVAYFSVSQYISNKRIVELLSNLFNLQISEGSVTALLAKASKLSKKEINKITKFLENSPVIGIDETGCKINKEKHWHWTFQDSDNTLIVANKSRGRKVINETFKNGFQNACVVHDNYSSYSKLNCKSEQLCLAHKLRDLNYAIESDNSKIAKGLKTVIQEAIKDDKQNLSKEQRVLMKKRHEKKLETFLLMQTIPKSETDKQVKSFTKAKERIFTFLLDENIPADNNASERAIRNVKVKQKVSGQFKSLEGAQNYAALRSIVDTSRKRGLNEFDSLEQIMMGNSLF